MYRTRLILYLRKFKLEINSGTILLQLIISFISLLVIILFLLDRLISKFFKSPYPHNLRGKILPNHEKITLQPKFSPHSLIMRKWSNYQSNKSILLVHGWDSSMGFFHKHVKFFVENDFTVYTLDFTSHGESDHKNLITIYTIAEDIQAAVKYIHNTNKSEDLIVYGHSLGGVSLVVGLGNGQITEEYVSYVVTEGIYAHGIYVINRFLQKYRLPSFITRILIPIVRRKVLSTIHKNNPIKKQAKDLLLMNPIDQIKNISIPLLMLHPAKDQIVSIKELRKFESLNLPNVNTVELNKGTHFNTSNFEEYWHFITSRLNI
jgi:alpha-beta hydrolase superfamily lysophospholipase